MKIVFASHTYMDPHLVVGSQHLARRFAEMGHHVLHLSCPITVPHLFLRNRNSRYADRTALWNSAGKKHSPTLIESVPLALIPWNVARHFLKKERNPFGWYSASTRGIVLRHGFTQPDLLLMDDPRFLGLERWLKPRRFVYRATDFYSQMKNDRSIDTVEKWAVEKCDGLIATAAPLLRHLQKYAPSKPSLLLENGADNEHFSRSTTPPPAYQRIPQPRVIYVGALDDRFDFDLTEKLAAANPEVHFVLIGPGNEEGRLPQKANIHLLGQIAYEEIPRWLQHADIGLLPMNSHPANLGRSPMKLYEYAAAGLPVLARATPEISRRQDRFVFLYEDADSAQKQLTRLLANMPEREATRKEALQHSWKSRAASLLDFCEKLPLRT